MIFKTRFYLFLFVSLFIHAVTIFFPFLSCPPGSSISIAADFKCPDSPWAPSHCSQDNDYTPPPPTSIPEEVDNEEHGNSGSANFYVLFDKQTGKLTLDNRLDNAQTVIWTLNPEDRLNYLNPTSGDWGPNISTFALPASIYEVSLPDMRGIERALSFGKYKFWVNLNGESKFTTVEVPDDMRTFDPSARITTPNPTGLTYVSRKALLATMAMWNSSWDSGVAFKGCSYVPLGITAPGLTSRYLTDETARVYFSVGVKCNDKGRWTTSDKGERVYVQPEMPKPAEATACYDQNCRSSLRLYTIPYEYSDDGLADYVYKEKIEDPDPMSDKTAYYEERYFVLSNHLDLSIPFLVQKRLYYNISIASMAGQGSTLGPWLRTFYPPSGTLVQENKSGEETTLDITTSGRIINRLNLSAKVERANNYRGGFYAYLLLDKNNDNLYEDIRYIPIENDEVDYDLTFMAEDYPDTNTTDDQIIAEGTELVDGAQTVNFSLEVFDDHNMLVAGAGTGMNFNVFVPGPTSIPVGMKVSTLMDDENSELDIKYEIVWGPKNNTDPVPIYLAIQQGNGGAVYLVGEGAEQISAIKMPFYIIDAGTEGGKTSGTLTAKITPNGFWSFLYKGTYKIYLYYFNGQANVGAQTAITIR